jgi:NAD(P)-dependent dehydrogenase (short-subunit alcohol dehydrogenase family)
MNGKVALITGSSSGFGLLTTVELAKRGYKVVATMRDTSRRGRLDEALGAAGLKDSVDVRRMDITDQGTLFATIEQIIKYHTRIDVLVNNAGFAMAGFAEDMRYAEIRQQFETNFFGHVAVTKSVLPVMRAQKSGHIIMVSSISGLVAQPVVSSYSASKFALEGWSEALRIETHSLGVRVVLVEPGAFATDIWDRNVKVGAFALDPKSPNHERGGRYSQFVKTQVTKADPKIVSTLIADIADDPNPRLRYVVGRDAKMQLWLKRLLPWKRYEKVIAKAVKID